MFLDDSVDPVEAIDEPYDPASDAVLARAAEVVAAYIADPHGEPTAELVLAFIGDTVAAEVVGDAVIAILDTTHSLLTAALGQRKAQMRAEALRDWIREGLVDEARIQDELNRA
ncbi:hypothetical protein [Mycobacteroides abscessus]|uniref:hypothetical protein n=1 Tax=Mycobacteroides abscessus TaxID=36809 RepID=UPI00092B7D3F|nr:hypothetical protein [Mycobacteroides abscessus]MBE5495628.1 hypothetical protein [Mycobacteroides abscessus]SHO97285.1 Uncharacterised protein [Mycobacteroides abscessus subsp. abscessus]SHP91414.1 Uncharacterised protein [Mycobacteroides abscessus subsp. abscessus]SHP95003.1 Uncharacterised protein [Mycobacteroides abscessus subsp. abscessus]SHQ19800.1 Uncharacterised protein [Mycobacteroides abscessus subsp. abscessus]